MIDSEIRESFGVCRRTPSEALSSDSNTITRVPYGNDKYKLFTYESIGDTGDWCITLPWHSDNSQEKQDMAKIPDE